ncbi:DUF5753 domain-containing protein [Streptomyces sp. NBC_01136]|uniref:Scr1 family TA system antitoxin-like transcriptional regulator n=1 Tax=unclassified Streptomyces TaxID=2593676 RepID=UPI0032436F5E|nr:DUF5753 domain-containing protein [Streptomyces sp. NBC_01136]
MPGLLQTEGYARAVLGLGLPRISPEILERRVSLRAKRQELLKRTDPEPPQLWAIMDEAEGAKSGLADFPLA